MNLPVADSSGAPPAPASPVLLEAVWPAAEGAARSLLDAVLEATARGGAAPRLEQFLAEPSPAKALALWLGRPADGLTKEQLARQLSRDVARLDGLLSDQVNAILHHPRFQALEASWRGLRYLVEQRPEGDAVKVRVLNLSWRELARDLERAVEFDQSQLFRKVYEQEFGHPGGEPFGVLLGDYEVRHLPTADPPVDHLGTLARIAQTAAAAFAPFIAGAHPALLDLTSFGELEKPLNLPRTLEQVEYLKWRAFRETEDARFVGLTLPRVLLRLPYRDDGSRADGFRFREDVEGPDRSRYLWGNAAFAFGAVLVRAFGESRWLADVRGAPQDRVGGGLVTGLPVHSFATERAGVAPKCSTEVMLTDAREKELGELGLIPLCHCPDTELAAFYGNQSVQRPAKYDEAAATANARLSAMLQYMLCTSRIAHYVKVIGRDKLGAFAEPGDLEDYLSQWLRKYTTQNEKAGPEVKAQYPLREARVRVRERDGHPGSYVCEVHLRPHFQLDQMVAAVKLVTELTPARPGS
jgi:type VI secretion system ImpC/EvpB family protein